MLNAKVSVWTTHVLRISHGPAEMMHSARDHKCVSQAARAFSMGRVMLQSNVQLVY